ncbi:transcriptional repressor [Spirosoma oryzicola]|uniref:transcriptional repressor n=1 Tax=Spirosoma oryzicola TaxID=2898794 RepID=UPI001E439577|nr:transcriptional repressor [Spirosoma oryzicola]UHG94829.1 transcriptional repressor [Spirosoma oryzicola]
MCRLTDKIIAYSQQNGYRYAAKRVAVALTLSQFKSYTDADVLWLSLRVNYPRISKATVYISLRWLLTAGLAQRKLRQDRVCTYRIVRTIVN